MAQVTIPSSGRTRKFGRGEWLWFWGLIGFLAFIFAAPYIGDQLRQPQQVIPHEYTEFAGAIPPIR